MAQQMPQANDKKRVKVYELRENDWYDRGTGFCTGQVVNVSRTVFSRKMLYYSSCAVAPGLPLQKQTV